MLDLVDLRAFARIADLGGVSSAARALRMPKSSVSRSLVRLEEAVGAVLVERSTRHLRLTDAGLLLRRHARRILDDVGEAENAIGGLVGAPRGDLRISVPFTFAAGSLAPMLPAFCRSTSTTPRRRARWRCCCGRASHRPARKSETICVAWCAASASIGLTRG